MSELILPDNNANWDEIIRFLEPEPPKYCPESPTIKQKAFLRTEAFEALFGGGAGGGKELSVNTVIITPNGWATIGELKVGDFVFDENGDPVEVLAKSELLYNPTYRVTMADGEEIIAGQDHLWNVATERDRARYKNALPENQAARRANRALRGQTTDRLTMKAAEKGDGRGLSVATSESTSLNNSKRAAAARENKPRPNIWDYTRVVTTKEIIELQKTERKRISIPNAAPIQGAGEWKSAIPPYTLGAWLGDGSSLNGTICVCDDDKDAFMSELESDGWHVEVKVSIQEGKNPIYNLHLSKNGIKLRSFLKEEGFLKNKHVPDWIMHAPFADRQAFLGGFCDTDGHVDERGRIQFCLAKQDMVEAVHSLFWSIGCTPTSVKHRKTTNQDPIFSGDAWRFDVSQCGEYIFRMPRKRDKLVAAAKKVKTTEYRQIKSIEPIETVAKQCIQVDNPRGLFRVGKTFLTTHNSSALLMAALQWVHVPGYSAIIFRNTFRDLALPNAIMDRAKMWFSQYPEIKWSEKDYRATFPSGATLTFGYLESASDHFSYQGMETQFVGFDEVTQIKEEHYNYLLGRLRKPDIKTGRELAKVPLRARASCNPSPNWVRRYFLEEGPSHGRIFVPSLLDDNPYLDDSYRLSLERLSPVLRAQWEFGDWYAEETGIMFDRDDFRIISPNEVPEFDSRSIVRFWDLAATKPSRLNPDPDWTVGVKAGMKDGYLFILDVIRFRDSSDVVERRILETAHQDGADVKIRMDQDPGQAGKPVSIESEVQMADGSVKLLKDVEVGDMVITHTGRPQKVLEYFKQGYLDGVRLHTKSGRVIEAALDHPIFTPVGWVEAGKLQEGDFVGLLRGFTVGATSRFNEEARLIGYFLGDGSCSISGTSLASSITVVDDAEREDIKHICNVLGFKTKDGRDNKTIHLSGGVKDWLREVGLAGKTSFTKRVPEWCFTQSNEFLAHLIGAYFACDGSIAKDQKGAELYSVHKALLIDAQRILIRLGIYSELREKKGIYLESRHTSWRLYIPVNKGDALRQLKLNIPVYNDAKLSRMDDVRTVNEFWGPYISDQIVKVERDSFECACLTVENDHTFLVSDVIVHNSQTSHYGRNVLLGFDFAGVPIPRDKVARVNLWAPKAKRGEILLVRGDWPGDFIEEALSFGPNSTAVHDDQMDAVSGAFETLTGIHLKKRGTVRLLV